MANVNVHLLEGKLSGRYWIDFDIKRDLGRV